MSSQPAADMSSSRYADNMLEAEKNLFKDYELAPESSLNVNKLLYLELFRELLKDFRGCKFLNVGCGKDILFSSLQQGGAEIVELDIVLEPLKKIKKHGAQNVIRADIYNLPFKENTFDLAFTIGVLHHLIFVENAISGIIRVVKENRFIVFSEPNKFFLPTKLIESLPFDLAFNMRSQIIPKVFPSYVGPAEYEHTLDPIKVKNFMQSNVKLVEELFDVTPQIAFHSSTLKLKLWEMLVSIPISLKIMKIFIAHKFVVICQK